MSNGKTATKERMTNEEARAILEEVRTIDDSMYQYNPAYLEALDMAIAALKAEPCGDVVSRKHLLSGIDELMQSPWFNRYKDDGGALHFGYIERKEAVEVVRDLCIKAEPCLIEIPDNATNGDVIKALFPDLRLFTDFTYLATGVKFSWYWWNAPYKREGVE